MRTLSVLDLFSKQADAGTPAEFRDALVKHIEQTFDKAPLPRSGKSALRVIRLEDVELPDSQGTPSASGAMIVWRDLTLAEVEKRLSAPGKLSLLAAFVDPETGSFADDFASATREDCDIYIVGESSNPETQKIIEARLGYVAMMGALGIQITGLRLT
jgi:hypothetical protein